jgi:hypothetical protein
MRDWGRAPVWLVCAAVTGVVTGIVTGVAREAAAKTISITISQKAELRGATLVVSTTVGNTGDESAKAVAANLRFGEKHVRGKVHDDVPPNGTFDEELSIETGDLAPGRWPYQVAVDYADANLYPFQALLVTTLPVGDSSTAKLSVPRIESEGIADSGPIHITFKNLAGTERDAGYRVMAPEGLEPLEPTGTVHLKGWAEQTVSATIVNRTALAGSKYPVFVATEYDEGGTHYSVVAQSIVEIVAPRNLWEKYQTLLIGGAVLLVALWVAVVVRGTMSRKP